MKKLLIGALVFLCTGCVTFEHHQVQAPEATFVLVPTNNGLLKFDSMSGRVWALMGDHWVEFPNKQINGKFQLIQKDKQETEPTPASKKD